jgi:hypothetical protein
MKSIVIGVMPQEQIEPPRDLSRLFCVSQAAMACSANWR